MNLKSTRSKLAVSAVVVGAAAAIAGLGTFGSFTSTTSASTDVSSGTVNIALGAAGSADNRLTIGASGLVPGDTIQRAAKLSNTGEGLSGITLTSTATTSSKLDTDASNGLQLRLESCSKPWTESGTAPAYTYTCGGNQTTLVASRPVIGQNLPLTGSNALAARSSDNLRVTLSFPTSAGNELQNQSSTINFAFTGTQRTGTDK